MAFACTVTKGYTWKEGEHQTARKLNLAATPIVTTILSTQTPASATATAVTGTVSFDADYIYVATATNTWKRAAIATWP